MPNTVLPYPIDPVEIVLSDGVPRRVRYTAAALKRIEKAQKALSADSGMTGFDQIALVIWEGLLDREGLENAEALLDLIDSRAIDYLNERLAEAMPKKNPLTPAGQP